jgi:hypothetical protein
MPGDGRMILEQSGKLIRKDNMYEKNQITFSTEYIHTSLLHSMDP